MKTTKENVTNIIKELGIPANVKGYHYIRCGVELMINDSELMCSMMPLYKKVAKCFNTTPSRAERAIRHAIEVGWDRANVDFAKKMFGYSVDDKVKPTNSEFLATIADYVLVSGDCEKGGE